MILGVLIWKMQFDNYGTGSRAPKRIVIINRDEPGERHRTQTAGVAVSRHRTPQRRLALHKPTHFR